MTGSPVLILQGLSLEQLRGLLREEVRGVLREERVEGAKTQSFGTQELEVILNKRGSALREWLRRHPDFPRRRAGRKLVFDRLEVEKYLADRGISEK